MCAGALTPTPCPQNCLFDTCNCEKSEDCLCAALSAYVRACAAKGVLLSGWRAGVCSECAAGQPQGLEDTLPGPRAPAPGSEARGPWDPAQEGGLSRDGEPAAGGGGLS